jgi:hypothetical protein
MIVGLSWAVVSKAGKQRQQERAAQRKAERDRRRRRERLRKYAVVALVIVLLGGAITAAVFADRAGAAPAGSVGGVAGLQILHHAQGI